MPDALQTELLYYRDVYLRDCNANVVSKKPEGDIVWLALDRTIFYPGGGGQLPDCGTMDGFAVSEVRKEDDLVWHACPAGSVPKSEQVTLNLDWDYRFHRMQQHSGQHLLSYILQQMDMPTVSVHLGEALTLIETSAEPPDEQQLKAIEAQANILIRQRVPFRTHWTDREGVSRFPLRRPAGDWQKLRVVEIEGYDYAACGGTHVTNSAEIGLIKVMGAEKIRGHARLQFAIGTAAYELFDQSYREQQQLKVLLQAEPGQLAGRAEQIDSALADEKKARKFYRDGYLQALAESLVQKDAAPILFYRLPGAEAQDAEDLARYIANTYQQPAFVCSGNRFYFPGPRGGWLDGRAFMQIYGSDLGLRGGGPPDFVQGIIAEERDEELQQALQTFATEHAEKP